MFKHILVATDGSEASFKSIKYAVELAQKHQCKLTALTVSVPYSLSSFTFSGQDSPIDCDDYDKTIEEAANNILQKANDIAAAADVMIATRHVFEVSAATAIVDAASQLNCDLIIMASHGRRGVARKLLGSQTHEVLQMSQIPVLVYR